MRVSLDRACALLVGADVETSNVETAFDAHGSLTRPVLLSFEGDARAVQMAFARAGLTVRVGAGALVLDPRSARQKSDLRRLLEGFEALGQEGVTAIADAGKTRAAAWELVDQRAGVPDAPALFWLDGAARFDDVGQLTTDVVLYWRGDRDRSVAALRRAGVRLVDPQGDEPLVVRALPVSSLEEAMPMMYFSPRSLLIATAEEVHELERAKSRPPSLAGGSRRLKLLERRRWSRTDDGCDPPRVVKLAIGPDDGALAAAWHGGFPRVALIDLASSLTVASFVPEMPEGAICGGLSLLPDGRLVFSWRDFVRGSAPGTDGSLATLHVWDPADDSDREVARYVRSHVGHDALSDVDRSGRWVALATGRSRTESDPMVAMLQPRVGTTFVFDVAHGFTCSELRVPHASSAMVAISPDGTHLVSSEAGGTIACFTRAGADLLWTVDPHDHRDGREIHALGWAPSSDTLCALVTRQLTSGPAKGKKKATTTNERRLKCFDVASGRAACAELEASTIGLTAFAFHPSGKEIAVGDEAGAVRFFSYPDGALLETISIFAPSKGLPFGGTTTLAFSRSGKLFAAGDATGEIVVAACSSP